MRLPFGHGIRGLTRHGCLFALLAFASSGTNTAGAQDLLQTIPRQTGHINFVTTGGSLRTQPNDNTTNTVECQVAPTSTQMLSGIPAGTTITSAYLYWGGSGGTADTNVTLNGNTVTASRTFARTFVNGGTNYPYFGGFAEVTSLVTSAGSYTFGNLTVNTGAPHCDRAAVVSGWSLVVIYTGAAERLRAINIYDGLREFFGSDVVLPFSGFRIPPANIDGRVAVFTLEGDPQNSDPSGGFSEALRFNGTLLDDGLTPTGSNPTVQQFDGTISSQGVITSYGIDVDQYDVSGLLTPGQTTATTTYSAGADLVLLMTQIMSATSEPAVDLSITKTHTGAFVSGGTGQYTIVVSNAAGAEREDNTVTVTDTLPAGLTFNSGTGTGWICGAVGQVVTCTHPATLNPGASFPPLTLTVNVLESAAASVTNTAVVSTPSYELSTATANNTVTDVTATLDPNLSTSTKTYVDLNGGEVAPGDTLRYTVTLRESAGGQAVNVSMTDNIPDNTVFASFFSIPAGATSAYAPPPAGPPINNGMITVSGITVPASSTVTVVFDVTVIANTAPGETIDNTATINNPNGAENNPAAPQIIVTPSLIPASGTKFLYLRRDNAGTKNLSRNRPSAADVNESVPGAGSDAFVITPALRGPLTIPTGTIPVRLWLSRTNGASNRDITVTLSSTPGGTIATQTLSINPNNATTPAIANFALVNGTVRNLAAGTTLTLTVANGASNAAANAFLIWPNGNGGTTGTVPNNSRVELNTTTVINVNSVLTYNAAYNTGAVQGTFYPNTNVFVRALISDPFGAFDISNARITITDPTNVDRVPNALMTAQAASGCGLTTGATCIFQTQYLVPAAPALGVWRIRVTGLEGVEDTVTDYNIGEFTVAIPQPSLTILKSSQVLSDPVNNTTFPKRIPRAVVQYDVTVANSGPGTVDSGTLVITDAIPADAAMYVSTSSGPPVMFSNGTPASGLIYDYATHVTYSSVGAAGPWVYTPSPDPSGYDPAVRAVRISPAGVMSAAGSGNPAFTIQFRVRID